MADCLGMLDDVDEFDNELGPLPYVDEETRDIILQMKLGAILNLGEPMRRMFFSRFCAFFLPQVIDVFCTLPDGKILPRFERYVELLQFLMDTIYFARYMLSDDHRAVRRRRTFAKRYAEQLILHGPNLDIMLDNPQVPKDEEKALLYMYQATDVLLRTVTLQASIGGDSFIPLKLRMDVLSFTERWLVRCSNRNRTSQSRMFRCLRMILLEDQGFESQILYLTDVYEALSSCTV